MRNYTVFFEVFGKKMKCDVLAGDESDAKNKLLKKIIFHQVKLNEKDYFNKAMNTMDDICDALNIGKPKL